MWPLKSKEEDIGDKKKFKKKDVESAHEKQLRKVKGEGGVIFTDIEREIIDSHVKIDEYEEEENAKQESSPS